MNEREPLIDESWGKVKIADYKAEKDLHKTHELCLEIVQNLFLIKDKYESKCPKAENIFDKELFTIIENIVRQETSSFDKKDFLEIINTLKHKIISLNGILQHCFNT